MKKILIILFCCLCATALAIIVWKNLPEQEETAPVNTPQEETAVLSCADGTFYFGTVKEDEGPLEHTFTIQNTGNAPLIIVSCDGSCGCISADWTRQPIAPGETGTIHLYYNPQGVNGMVVKTLNVISNARNSLFQLYVKGEVKM